MPRFRFIVSLCTIVFAAIAWPAHAQEPWDRNNTTRNSSEVPGVLEPWMICDVACAESGIIEEIYVNVGRRVSTGSLIAKLRSDAIEKQLEISRSQAAAQGKILSAKAETEFSQWKLEETTKAYQKKHSSESELNRADIEYKIAQGRLQVETEEAAVLALQVDRLETQLAQRTIQSPIDGIVVNIEKKVGELLAPNTPTVARIVNVSRLRAEFLLLPDIANGLRPDQNVSIRVDQNRIASGTIEFIAPIAEPDGGLITIHVLIENPKEDIRSSTCHLIQPIPGQKLTQN